MSVIVRALVFLTMAGLVAAGMQIIDDAAAKRKPPPAITALKFQSP